MGYIALILKFIGVPTPVLNNFSAWVASGTYTLAVIVLLYSLLGIAARRGNSRLVYFGFALFGWGYFIHAFVWDSSGPPDLFPSMLSDYLHERHRNPDQEVVMRYDASSTYRVISDSFVSILAGYFGSLLALTLATRPKVQVRMSGDSVTIESNHRQNGWG